MMQSLKIVNKDEVTLCINDDESRWVRFDTEDLNLYARLKELYQTLGEKAKELTSRGEEAEKIEGNDEYGIPLAGWAIVDLQKEFADTTIKSLDAAFGEGTCQRLFGNSFNPEVYGEFLKGVLTYISKAREKKLNEALAKTPAKKKVMK